MKWKSARDRGMVRFVTRLKDGNVLRLVILSGLVAIAAAGTLVTSCKSRYGFTKSAKDGAEGSDQAIPKTTNQTPDDPVTNSLPTTPSASTGTTSTGGSTTQNTPAVEPAPSLPGGPVAGIEAWQEGKLVTTIVTGKTVVFKPTAWTRDTSAEQGCALNRGIIQASWTVGSKPATDIQRFAGQECQAFDYSGVFTKPGAISVQLEVVAVDGEQAQATASFPVTGEAVTIPGQNPLDSTAPSSDPKKPGQTPTQQ